MISGAEDSVIIIWKAKEWSLLFRLKGHKDSVYDMALHDTGKLLASVGKDRKVILWNLINGGKVFRKTMPFSNYIDFLVLIVKKTPTESSGLLKKIS